MADETRTVVDDGSEHKPTETDYGISEHDGKTDPDYPSFASSCPVAHRPWSPALGLCEGRQKAPADDGSKEHVHGGSRAHDNALPNICWRWVESPEPVVG